MLGIEKVKDRAANERPVSSEMIKSFFDDEQELNKVNRNSSCLV